MIRVQIRPAGRFKPDDVDGYEMFFQDIMERQLSKLDRVSDNEDQVSNLMTVYVINLNDKQ